MELVLLTGTFLTAFTERPIAHGLSATPDFVVVDCYTSTNDWLAWLSLDTAAIGYTAATVYVAATAIATRFGALAVVWQGRSY